MVLIMSRPWKHPDTGYYYVRRHVPNDLRLLVGKSVFKKSLATKDIEIAKSRFAVEIVKLEKRWANLRASKQKFSERDAHTLAKTCYEYWLDFFRDEPSMQILWHPEYYSRMWTGGALTYDSNGAAPIDQLLIRYMEQFSLQKADLGIQEHGLTLDTYDRLKFAKAIAAAFQRASVLLAREAQGIYGADVSNSPSEQLNVVTQNAEPDPSATRREGTTSTETLITLLNDWWREAQAGGRKLSTYESYKNTMTSFVAFLGHDSISQLKENDVIRFKDFRLATPSPSTGRIPSAKTVKDSDLAALKTVFGWAVANRRLSSNPALGVTIKLAKPQRLRSKSFTDAEAFAILKAASAHTGANESAKTASAKRWVPWLCAYTGARVGEIAQLRKEDISQQGEFWVIRITPEAGTVKTNEARMVVLHPDIVQRGFIDFVRNSVDGHLFLQPADNGIVLGPLQGLKNRLAEFSRAIVSDRGVAPNHGWRHRFKTIGLEAEISSRVLDAIQGQAPRSVAETYGDVTVKTIAAAIYKFPRYEIP